MTVTLGDNNFNFTAYNANASWAKDLSIFTGNYYSTTLNTRYSLIIKEEKLVLTHPRIEHVLLNPKIPDLFTGNQRHFSSMKFKRDATGKIKGFQLSTNGVNDIWFQKVTVGSNNLVKIK